MSGAWPCSVRNTYITGKSHQTMFQVQRALVHCLIFFAMAGLISRHSPCNCTTNTQRVEIDSKGMCGGLRLTYPPVMPGSSNLPLCQGCGCWPCLHNWQKKSPDSVPEPIGPWHTIWCILLWFNHCFLIRVITNDNYIFLGSIGLMMVRGLWQDSRNALAMFPLK